MACDHAALRSFTLKMCPDGGFPLAAFLVLALGAFLRFYQLGAPSMWGDEMLVALNASKDAGYIFSLAENVEVHPPYLYFLYKLMLLAGSSDFWLRLPSAVCGVLSLFFLWRLGERLLESRFAALAALGLLAVHPLHIWISRQVRPYALIGLCFTLALGFLLRFVATGEPRQARCNLLACLPIVLSHYVGFLILAAQGLVAAWAALRRGVPSLSGVARWGLGMAVCAAPSAYFFWAAKFQRQEASIEAGKGFGPALVKVLAGLKGVLAFGTDLPYAWMVPAGIMLAGVLVLAVRRSPASALVALFLLPPAMLVLSQYSGLLLAVHLSFLLPVAALLAGVGVDRLVPSALRRPVALLALCLCLSGAFLWTKGRDFYDAKSVVATWWHMGFFKDIGTFTHETFRPEVMLSFHDLGLYESVNWYASRRLGSGVPTDQRLGPDGEAVVAVFVTNYENFGHLFKNTEEFRNIFDESATVLQRDNIRFYQAAIARTPEKISLASGRFVTELTANPTDVYARAWTLRDMSIWPYFGCALFPTKPRQPGEVVYRFKAGADGGPSRLNLLADFDLEAPGNTLRIERRFDDGPWTPVVEESGMARGASRLARFSRAEPYRDLWLRVTLVAGETAATSVYGALEQVRLQRLVLFSDQEGARFGSGSLHVSETGLGAMEFLPGGIASRWGLGDSTVLACAETPAGALRLSYRFVSRLPGQRVEVLADGEPVAVHDGGQPGAEVAGELSLNGRAGPRRVEFRYSTWNHKDPTETFAPGDPRPLAVLFTGLSLEAQDFGGPASVVQDLPR